MSLPEFFRLEHLFVWCWTPDLFEVALLLGACFLVNYVTADSKTNWLEGYLLVSFYIMIVSTTLYRSMFFCPLTSSQIDVMCMVLYWTDGSRRVARLREYRDGFGFWR